MHNLSLFIFLIPASLVNGFALKDTCKCQPFLECEWSKITNDRLNSNIAKVIKAQLRSSFQQTICNVEKMNVWCCENTKGESVQPEFKDIEDLNKQYCSSDKVSIWKGPGYTVMDIRLLNKPQCP